MPGEEKLLIVSPVFNEADHLERTARALAAQTRPPTRWVVVDDGSRDDTAALARRLAAEIAFMEVIDSGQDDGIGPDKLAEAREARAFNHGLERAAWRDYDFIGKLDGDVELPPEWFETLLARFREDPRLGL
ncbi:MAG TPA: glycosyltransferase family A protein, partial [Solirubrobacterales bacterium]